MEGPADRRLGSSGDSSCSDGPGIIVNVVVTVLLFNLIAGLAGTVDVGSLRAQLRRARGIGCGLLCQFLLMPLIGFIVVTVAEPEPHVGMMILILCSSSGGAYSNWWCSLFNADLALSVAMTAVSTLLSGAMMPLNLMLYISLMNSHTEMEVPWADIAQSLAVVLAAIATGILASTRCPAAKAWMGRVGNVSGVLMIGTSLVASSVKMRRGDGAGSDVTPLWGHEASFYLMVLSPFAFSVLASLLVSSLSCLHLERPERLAVVIEVSYQNVGIASAVAVAAFCGNPRLLADAAAVPVLYGLIEAVCLALFCLVMWKLGWSYSPKEAGLCASIFGDFQPRHVAEPAPGDANADAVADDAEAGRKDVVSEWSMTTREPPASEDSGECVSPLRRAAMQAW